MTNIYKRALKNWGEDKQLIVLMEECAELIQACSKRIRRRTNNFAEEIADVQIMINQMRLLDKGEVGRTIDKLKQIKLQKLEVILNLPEVKPE